MSCEQKLNKFEYPFFMCFNAIKFSQNNIQLVKCQLMETFKTYTNNYLVVDFMSIIKDHHNCIMYSMI